MTTTGAPATGPLDGRIALVTGAADGIGRATVAAFAQAGAQVMVTDVDGAAARRVASELTAAGGRADHLRMDVLVEDEVVAAVATTVARFGGLDVLVNNAWGGGSLGRLEHKTDDQMRHGIEMAYLGPFWAMRAAFPHLRDGGRGRIINLCSLNGVNAHVGTAEYNGGKEALRALTRTAAREWAHHGITANCVCPGAKTAAFRRLAERSPGMEAMADAANPMGRLGDPAADIAPVLVFLAGDGARYLTGNTLFVDGGAHINGVAWAPELPDPGADPGPGSGPGPGPGPGPVPGPGPDTVAEPDPSAPVR